MNSSNQNRCIISALARDRIGIFRDVVSPLSEMGANIDGISQSVLADYCAIILTATFPKHYATGEVQQRILRNFADGEVSLTVREYGSVLDDRRVPESERYVVTIAGRDRSGILRAVSSFLATKGIGINGWYVDFIGDYVSHIGEVSVPRQLDIQQLQDDFRDLLAPMKLSCGLQHSNIFRATSEVGSINNLCFTSRHA